MKTVNWYLSIGLVGCRKRGSFEVDDDTSDTEIYQMIHDEVMDRIEWGQESE